MHLNDLIFVSRTDLYSDRQISEDLHFLWPGYGMFLDNKRWTQDSGTDLDSDIRLVSRGTDKVDMKNRTKWLVFVSFTDYIWTSFKSA
jgi:hypothetical protein